MDNSPPSWPPSLPRPLPRHLAPELLRRHLERCRADPDPFLEWCLGPSFRQGRVHRELQHFLGTTPRALIELPRDHGKSTQVCGRLLWELGRDPSLRILVVCASERLALERGRFLRDRIERDSRVRLVFPALVPGSPWSEEAFTLKRPGGKIGPTVRLGGVGSALTGARVDLLVCDDIVDVRSIYSQAERQRVKTFFRENLMNLLEPTGRVWNLSTPWHRHDLNGELRANPAFALFRRAVGPDLSPVWPEHWPRDRLEARRREVGSASFLRGYQLTYPTEGEALVQPGWIHHWTAPEEYPRKVLAIDPAVATHARADQTALVALGLTAGNKVHCLEALGQRLPASELPALIERLDARWNPETILYEANAAFAGLGEMLQRHPGFGHRVRLVTQTRAKPGRIAVFAIQVERGEFLLHGLDAETVVPGQAALREQMLIYPHGDHDDLLDAAALGAEHLLTRREPRVW